MPPPPTRRWAAIATHIDMDLMGQLEKGGRWRKRAPNTRWGFLDVVRQPFFVEREAQRLIDIVYQWTSPNGTVETLHWLVPAVFYHQQCALSLPSEDPKIPLSFPESGPPTYTIDLQQYDIDAVPELLKQFLCMGDYYPTNPLKMRTCAEVINGKHGEITTTATRDAFAANTAMYRLGEDLQSERLKAVAQDKLLLKLTRRFDARDFFDFFEQECQKMTMDIISFFLTVAAWKYFQMPTSPLSICPEMNMIQRLILVQDKLGVRLPDMKKEQIGEMMRDELDRLHDRRARNKEAKSNKRCADETLPDAPAAKRMQEDESSRKFDMDSDKDICNGSRFAASCTIDEN